MGLAWLHIVDIVLILDCGQLEDAIRLLPPKSLVLGKEFEKEQQVLLKGALNALQEAGGTVVFHAGEVHYATIELLRDEPADEQEPQKQFRQTCHKQKISATDLHQALERFSQSRLLVLGDTIVDQYIACDALGMSAEAPVLVVREMKAKEFLGGAAIVAAHVSSLGAKCHYLSVVGEDSHGQLIKQQLQRYHVPHTLLPDSSRPTTFKIRYMVEKQKLFRVSRLKDHSLSEIVEEQLIERLWDLAPEMDGILISDFVYGVITENILAVLQELKKKYGLKLLGDLQCSSQVGNVGKFQNFDLLTPLRRKPAPLWGIEMIQWNGSPRH